MKETLKLIRPLNLLMVALTMYLARFCISNTPLYASNAYYSLLEQWQYAVLVISTICIGAGGYIINDIFDVDIDIVNKPNEVLIGNTITEKNAFRLYFLFTGIGLLLAGYLAWDIGNIKLAILQVLVIVLLFGYAQYLKRTMVIGNIVVALCTAFTLGILIFYEIDLKHNMTSQQAVLMMGVYYSLLVYSFFAFWTTLIREMVKDIEDMQGDHDFDCRTLPIVVGVNKTSWIITVLNMILFFFLVTFLFLFYQNQYWAGVAVVSALVAPVLFFQYKLWKAKEKKDYSFLSLLMKIIMLLGVLTMALLHNGDAPKIFTSFMDMAGLK